MKQLIKKGTILLTGSLIIASLSSSIFDVHAYWSIDKDGNVINSTYTPGQVLGEEDKKQEEKKEEQKKEEEKKREQEQTKEEKKEDTNDDAQNESKSEEKSSRQESEKPDGKITQSSEQHKLKSEDVEKVEIHRIENDLDASGESKMEVIIKKNNKEEINERQESFEMETENGDKVHIEMSPEKTQMEIKKNGISASVDLPLSINPTLKKLMLTTSEGDMMIESLPDEIVNGLKKDKQIDEQSNVQLEVKYENGQIVYKVEEKKHKKFVGIIPVDLIKNLSVADGTGIVLSEKESFVTKLLSLLSF